MRKLKLELDALQVESFEAMPDAGRRIGTVRGNEGTSGCSVEEVCSGDETCFGESCAVTACLTCLCPHTGPQPSCDPCSWQECYSFDPAGCP